MLFPWFPLAPDFFPGFSLCVCSMASICPPQPTTKQLPGNVPSSCKNQEPPLFSLGSSPLLCPRTPSVSQKNPPFFHSFYGSPRFFSLVCLPCPKKDPPLFSWLPLPQFFPWNPSMSIREIPLRTPRCTSRRSRRCSASPCADAPRRRAERAERVLAESGLPRLRGVF